MPAPSDLSAHLELYQLRYPRGADGDRQFRSDFHTDVLTTTDANIRGELGPDELHELTAYTGWNVWDWLGRRHTEGESGLLPRQEYESLSLLMVWQRYPEFIDVIMDAVGIDGLVAIGARARSEIGTAINPLHIWTTGVEAVSGRAIGIGLGLVQETERLDDLGKMLQFQRRLYHGLWGGGPIFSSMRGYEVPLLDQDLVDRFAGDVAPLPPGDTTTAAFLKFNAATELCSFMMHFDNRLGLADTGPYPLPDGRLMIVRDHIINEPAFHWSDKADGLPYCVTSAMTITPPPDFQLQVTDGGTTFTRPSNYLPFVDGVAIYVRDEWDTPMADIRRAEPGEVAAITERCQQTTMGMYRRIAAMPMRDRLSAGVQVYFAGFILPFARAAGVWDVLVDEHDFWRWDDVTEQAALMMTRDTALRQILPTLAIRGDQYFPPARAAAGAVAK